MIRICSDTRADPPPTPGLEVSDDEWVLDTDYYREFVAAATGMHLSNDPDPSDCYRIGNRLEAFIEDHNRRGEWTPALVESLPVVQSLGEIRGVALFFRQCHANRIAGFDSEPSPA